MKFYITNCATMVYRIRDETINFEGQEVKDRGRDAEVRSGDLAEASFSTSSVKYEGFLVGAIVHRYS